MTTEAASTYSSFTWDHETESWAPESSGLTKWQLRAEIRRLREDWEDFGFLIERETAGVDVVVVKAGAAEGAR